MVQLLELVHRGELMAFTSVLGCILLIISGLMVTSIEAHFIVRVFTVPQVLPIPTLNHHITVVGLVVLPKLLFVEDDS